jgi:hypothetical protein
MNLTMRKLSWALLLPLFLLFAQQGELRHEYGHYAKAASSCPKVAADAHHCPLCLAYAQLAGTVRTDAVPLALLSDLAFQFVPALRVASVDGEAASPRSRGPPSL